MISAPDPMSFTAPMSSWAGPGPSLTSAAASRAAAPLDTAMATASVSADTRSDGRATAAAAYVRPVSSLTAAPSADPTRALAERASVMIFRSSRPSSASVTRPSLLRRRVISGRFTAGRPLPAGRVPRGAVTGTERALRGAIARAPAVPRRAGRADVAGHRRAAVRSAILPLAILPLAGLPLAGLPLAGLPLAGLPLAILPLAILPLAGLRLSIRQLGGLRGILADAVPADLPHGHGADPVAPAGQVLGGQPQSGHGRGRAGDRNPPEPLGEQAADGLHVLGLDPDLEQLGQLVHRQPRRHPGLPVAEPLDRRLLPVVLVGDLADHRDPGEPAAQRERQRLPQRLAALDEDHVGARHHDLPHDRVAELEYRVDHRPLARLDHPAALEQVDETAQVLLLAGRAGLLPPAPAEHAAGRQQHRRDRPHQPDDRLHNGGSGVGHARRVLPSQRARHDPGHHVDDHGHDRARDQERPPGGA